MGSIRRALALSLLATTRLSAQAFICEEQIRVDTPLSQPAERDTNVDDDRFAAVSARHKLRGTASYYSGFFEGRKTANGEIFRHGRSTAAHLTLPLGTMVEVTSIATGRKLRIRVNDRGPYKGGFILDLSQSAARSLGVDRAHDRRVEIRILSLPGEPVPSEEGAEIEASVTEQ